MNFFLLLANPLFKLNDIFDDEMPWWGALFILAIIYLLGIACFGLGLKIGGVDWGNAFWGGSVFSAIWFFGRISILLSMYIIAGLVSLVGGRLLEAVSVAGLSETTSLQSWLVMQSYGWLVITLVLLYYCTFGILATIRKTFK